MIKLLQKTISDLTIVQSEFLPINKWLPAVSAASLWGRWALNTTTFDRSIPGALKWLPDVSDRPMGDHGILGKLQKSH